MYTFSPSLVWKRALQFLVVLTNLTPMVLRSLISPILKTCHVNVIYIYMWILETDVYINEVKTPDSDSGVQYLTVKTLPQYFTPQLIIDSFTYQDFFFLYSALPRRVSIKKMKRYWQLWLIHVRQWLYISALEKMLILKEPIFVVRTWFKVWGGGIWAQVSEGNRKVFRSVNCHFSHFFPFTTQALYLFQFLFRQALWVSAQKWIPGVRDGTITVNVLLC